MHHALFFDLADKIQQLLGAAHSKGRHHHIAALAQRFVDHRRQAFGIAGHLVVLPVAVGAFHHHIVGPVQQHRIPNDGLAHIADIAGKDDGFGNVSLRQRQGDAGAAQQMTCIGKHRFHTITQSHFLAVLAGVQIFLHLHGVCYGIKRLHFALAGTLAFAIEPHGVALLNMGAVKQHNLHQLRRQPSGQNPAAETLTDQQRKASGMIDMRVSHQHIINHPGLKRQRPVVDLITALLQPAVNQDLFPATSRQWQLPVTQRSAP